MIARKLSIKGLIVLSLFLGAGTGVKGQDLSDYKVLVDTTTMNSFRKLEGSYQQLYFSDLDSLYKKASDDKVVFVSVLYVYKGAFARGASNAEFYSDKLDRAEGRFRSIHPDKHNQTFVGDDLEMELYWNDNQVVRGDLLRPFYGIQLKDVSTGEVIQTIYFRTRKTLGTNAFFRKVCRKAGVK